MAANPREFAQEMLQFIANNLYDEEICLKYIEERMVFVYETAYAKGKIESAPKEEHSEPKYKGGTLYGLPCSSCGQYFPAHLDQCPTCVPVRSM